MSDLPIHFNITLQHPANRHFCDVCKWVQRRIEFALRKVSLTSSHMWKQLTWASENPPPLQIDWGETKQQERQKVLVLKCSHVFHAEKIFLLYKRYSAINPQIFFLCLFTLYLIFQANKYLFLLSHQTPSLTSLWTGFVLETVAQPGSGQTFRAAADAVQFASAWRNFV